MAVMSSAQPAKKRDKIAIIRRVPLDWARTQFNLGTALKSLGERESGTHYLQEAVKAYLSALEERTLERVPLDWAVTQESLGETLESLGEREPGTQNLQEAVEAIEEALKAFQAAGATYYVEVAEKDLTSARAKLQTRLNSAKKLQTVN